MHVKTLTMFVGAALLALTGAAAQAQAMPHHTAHHACKDSLHKAKQAFADTRLQVLKSPRANWRQLDELDNHMADVQRIERTVAAGHPMDKQTCDMLHAQVKGLHDLMSDLHTKGEHAHAPRATPPQAPVKK